MHLHYVGARWDLWRAGRMRWEVEGIKELIEASTYKSSCPLMDESHKHWVKHPIHCLWREAHKYAKWTHTGGRKWEKGCKRGETAIMGSKPKNRFILSTVTQLWLWTPPCMRLHNVEALLNVCYTRFFLNTHASIFSMIWKTISVAFPIFTTIHLG